jgi:hypothetical protein
VTDAAVSHPLSELVKRLITLATGLMELEQSALLMDAVAALRTIAPLQQELQQARDERDGAVVHYNKILQEAAERVKAAEEMLGVLLERHES